MLWSNFSWTRITVRKSRLDKAREAIKDDKWAALIKKVKAKGKSSTQNTESQYPNKHVGAVLNSQILRRHNSVYPAFLGRKHPFSESTKRFTLSIASI
jgi:spermidine/putrescine-binding protein